MAARIRHFRYLFSLAISLRSLFFPHIFYHLYIVLHACLRLYQSHCSFNAFTLPNYSLNMEMSVGVVFFSLVEFAHQHFIRFGEVYWAVCMMVCSYLDSSQWLLRKSENQFFFHTRKKHTYHNFSLTTLFLTGKVTYTLGHTHAIPTLMWFILGKSQFWWKSCDVTEITQVQKWHVSHCNSTKSRRIALGVVLSIDTTCFLTP